MNTSAAKPREFTGWHMLSITVSFFGVIIAVNVVLAWLANSTWSGLVVANSYVASQTFNRDEARNRVQRDRGWKVAVSHDSVSLTVRFADRAGQPLRGLVLMTELRRPATQSQDRQLSFNEGAPGTYSAPVKLAPGLWELAITASDQSAPTARDGTPGYAKAFRFVVQP